MANQSITGLYVLVVLMLIFQFFLYGNIPHHQETQPHILDPHLTNSPLRVYLFYQPSVGPFNERKRRLPLGIVSASFRQIELGRLVRAYTGELVHSNAICSLDRHDIITILAEFGYTGRDIADMITRSGLPHGQGVLVERRQDPGLC